MDFVQIAQLMGEYFLIYGRLMHASKNTLSINSGWTVTGFFPHTRLLRHLPPDCPFPVINVVHLMFLCGRCRRYADSVGLGLGLGVREISLDCQVNGVLS